MREVTFTSRYYLVKMPNMKSTIRQCSSAKDGISGMARLEARAKILKALAHPSRLRIIEVLSQGERCVCELHEIVGGDLSTVSKHLLVLKNAHLVSIEKRGLQVFYFLKAFCTISFLDCIEDLVCNAVREQLGLLSPRGSARGSPARAAVKKAPEKGRPQERAGRQREKTSR